MIEKKETAEAGTAGRGKASLLHIIMHSCLSAIPGRKEGYAMVELNGENYLDGIEASNLLGVKLSTLYTYVSRGVLRSYKQGIKRQRLYKRAEVEALLQLRPSADALPTSDPEQRESSRQLPYAEEWVSNI
jgi:excisionase family DNA binding protein